MRVEHCSLSLDAWDWPVARDAARIEAHWQRRIADIPALFNGATYLLRDVTVADGCLRASMFRTDFKTLLYWRSIGASRPVREAFGAALLRSAEGHVLLGRQGPGQLNSGWVYPPGGVLCDSDVHAGMIDIDVSTERELREETGLDAMELRRVPGYRVTFSGADVAIAIEWRSSLTSTELRQQILGFLARDPKPELDDVVIVTSIDAIDADAMPAHARLLLHSVLTA